MPRSKPVGLPANLEDRYNRAKKTGLTRHYAEDAPQLLEVNHHDVITGVEYGKYKGEITFFLAERSATFLFEFDPQNDVWRTTRDWND